MTLVLPTNWAPNHAPTAAELDQVLTAVRGAWTTYTPSWTASTTNPTLGNAVVSGRYAYVSATTVKVVINISLGSTSVKGVGNYTFSLPVAAADAAGYGACGVGFFNDSGAAVRPFLVIFSASTSVQMYLTANGTQLSSTAITGTFTTSSLRWEIEYEVA